jgi:hypothetical protein
MVSMYIMSDLIAAVKHCSYIHTDSMLCSHESQKAVNGIATDL